jgi:hypothetical protein
MFKVNTWVTSFPLRQESTHVFCGFCENEGYVKQWKYVSLNSKCTTFNSNMARDAC